MHTKVTNQLLVVALVALFIAFTISTALLVVRSRNSVWCVTERGVRSCDLGDYLVATSVEEKSSTVSLLHKPNQRLPIVQIRADHTIVFDADGNGGSLLVSREDITLAAMVDNRVLFGLHHPVVGRKWFSYAAYDSSRGAWIDNIDNGPDGHLDLRRIDVRGQPMKTEVLIEERWAEPGIKKR